LTSVFIISSLSFSMIRDLPPQLSKAFPSVRKKSLSLLQEDRKDKETIINIKFFIIKFLYLTTLSMKAN